MNSSQITNWSTLQDFCNDEIYIISSKPKHEHFSNEIKSEKQTNQGKQEN